MKILLVIFALFAIGCESVPILGNEETSERCWVTHDPAEYRLCADPPRNVTDSTYGCFACSIPGEI